MKESIFKLIFIIIVVVIITWGYYFLNKYYNFSIPCLFHEVTGFYCPGCGATRCLFSLLKGNLVESYNYNRLFFGLIPFLGVYIVYKAYLYVFNKRDNILIKIPTFVYVIMLIITITFGVLRNISEFSYLAP